MSHPPKTALVGLVLALLGLLPRTLLAARAGGELDQAVAAFERAAATGDLEAKEAALAQIEAGVDVIQTNRPASAARARDAWVKAHG